MAQAPIQSRMDMLLAGDTWKDGESTANVPRKESSSRAEQSQPGRRSILKAAAWSALLPGAGQYYNGRRTKAKYFFAAEVLTWVGYTAFRTYGSWKRDDYIRYAATNANAQLADKDDEFIDLVGFYDDIDEYNRLGRAFDPERPYLVDTDENHWRWSSQDDRRTFRDLKNRSREAYRRSDFMVGVAIIDRIISVIDAVRDAVRSNRRIGTDWSDNQERRLEFAVHPFSDKRQFELTLFPGL